MRREEHLQHRRYISTIQPMADAINNKTTHMSQINKNKQ